MLHAAIATVGGHQDVTRDEHQKHLQGVVHQQ